MKIILIGATGTIGKEVASKLKKLDHEVLLVGRSSGDYRVNIEDPSSIEALYKDIGGFDALANASGEVAFSPLEKLTSQQWQSSLQSKLMGQINLVQKALPYIREKGSFTLVSGILSDQPIMAGTVATTINRAIEGFVTAAACELPKSLRINVISPNLLKESQNKYGAFFPGFVPVSGELVAEAYVKSILGVQTGQTFRVL